MVRSGSSFWFFPCWRSGEVSGRSKGSPRKPFCGLSGKRLIRRGKRKTTTPLRYPRQVWITKLPRIRIRTHKKSPRRGDPRKKVLWFPGMAWSSDHAISCSISSLRASSVRIRTCANFCTGSLGTHPKPRNHTSCELRVFTLPL